MKMSNFSSKNKAIALLSYPEWTKREINSLDWRLKVMKMSHIW